jgi:hypothetical protein
MEGVRSLGRIEDGWRGDGDEGARVPSTAMKDWKRDGPWRVVVVNRRRRRRRRR